MKCHWFLLRTQFEITVRVNWDGIKQVLKIYVLKVHSLFKMVKAMKH